MSWTPYNIYKVITSNKSWLELQIYNTSIYKYFLLYINKMAENTIGP